MKPKTKQTTLWPFAVFVFLLLALVRHFSNINDLQYDRYYTIFNATKSKRRIRGVCWFSLSFLAHVFLVRQSNFLSLLVHAHYICTPHLVGGRKIRCENQKFYMVLVRWGIPKRRVTKECALWSWVCLHKPIYIYIYIYISLRRWFVRSSEFRFWWGSSSLSALIFPLQSAWRTHYLSQNAASRATGGGIMIFKSVFQQQRWEWMTLRWGGIR